ncbi:acyltransferase [Lithospermum erythrorhizon]|uniref:Alkyl transferase n=1 Tax=Lithospermum erythrorhizon TaxID=34254 RepID=A0AAV3PQ11_LITER
MNTKMISLKLGFPVSPRTPKTKQPNYTSFVSGHKSTLQILYPLSMPYFNVTLNTRIGVVSGSESQTAEGYNTSEPLPDGLQRDQMPNHVAIIMDGNRRWAKQKGQMVALGYEAGARSLRWITELCCKWGIRVLTVFAFSRENWLRPKMEVDFLMTLFERALKEELDYCIREDIRISVIGDTSRMSESLVELITKAEKATANNSKLHFVMAVNYSGQYDVVQACRRISQKVKAGEIEPEDVDGEMVEQELYTSCVDFPSPDLLIRTSGELRISNFLLWQLAYTELFFTDAHWPDFGEAEFVEALCSFQQRQRRYGGS